MKEIVINSKKHGQHIILVDDEDYEELSKHKWYVEKGGNTFYVHRRGKIAEGLKNKTVVMHRFLLDLSYGDKRVVDHIDGNGRNNQRSNLRICNNQENSMNVRIDNKHTLNSSSKYKGVSWIKQRGMWVTYIQVDGELKWLDRYTDEKVAAMGRDLASLRYHGEFACLNFPDALDRIDEFEKLIKEDREKVTFQTSKYFGVSKCRGKWRAIYKKKHLGYFDTEIEAHMVVEKYREKTSENHSGS